MDDGDRRTYSNTLTVVSCLDRQRNIAQRVMEIRGQIAKEMIQDLMEVGEENSLLMRETLLTSLSLDLEAEDKNLPDV